MKEYWYGDQSCWVSNCGRCMQNSGSTFLSCPHVSFLTVFPIVVAFSFSVIRMNEMSMQYRLRSFIYWALDTAYCDTFSGIGNLNTPWWLYIAPACSLPLQTVMLRWASFISSSPLSFCSCYPFFRLLSASVLPLLLLALPLPILFPSLLIFAISFPFLYLWPIALESKELLYD